MEKWQIELIQKLERSGYLDTHRSLVNSHARSFYWYDPDGPVGSSILHNGTISFVNTGEAILGITADHVYQQYLKDLEDNPSLKCQIGSATVQPENYLISSNEELDIAVLNVPEILINQSGARIHSAITWPPENLRESEIVLLGGFPGHRRVEGISQVQFDFVWFIPQIHQHSDDHLAISLNLPEAYWRYGKSLEQGVDLGGMSGAPVFRIVTEPLERLQLAGMVYQYAPTFEILRARQLSVVTSKGIIQAT